jgi:NADP-dependent 3-hydroxy acid dehydrogenase YdfG
MQTPFTFTCMATKTALITGASSGIGKAVALAFAKSGINLVLVGRSLDRLQPVAAAAVELGVQAHSYELDLGELAIVRSKIAEIVAKHGTLDILVNNAGTAYTNNLMDTPLADWQRIIDLNLSSVLQVIQGALPQLRQQQSGTIINLVSIGGQQAFPNWGAYCVSKFGLVALSKALAAEERSHGIRVTAIYPGSVNTGLWDREGVNADFDRNAMLDADTVAGAVLYAATAPAAAVIEELTIMPSAGVF